MAPERHLIIQVRAASAIPDEPDPEGTPAYVDLGQDQGHATAGRMRPWPAAARIEQGPRTSAGLGGRVLPSATVAAISTFPQHPNARCHRCGAEFVLTERRPTGHLPAETARTSTSFTIFEGTSETQRMIIGRAVTGLNVR